ncbi:GNAT family N-acetyltransferase [Streptodolium elevatio]
MVHGPDSHRRPRRLRHRRRRLPACRSGDPHPEPDGPPRVARARPARLRSRTPALRPVDRRIRGRRRGVRTHAALSRPPRAHPRRLARAARGRARRGGRPGGPFGECAHIGPVYTPPEHRGRGYGAAVTAARTEAALAAGADEVLLFTDLANPTSNSIYRKIGYEPVEDRVILTFDPRP